MKTISELENEYGTEDSFLNEDTCCMQFNSYLLDEMARIGKLPSTDYEIYMENGEGYIPHFHLCKKTGKNIIMRIRLLTNEYQRDKDDKKRTLTSSECKMLDTFLRQKISKLTRWEYLIETWNLHNPNHAIDASKVT